MRYPDSAYICDMPSFKIIQDAHGVLFDANGLQYPFHDMGVQESLWRFSMAVSRLFDAFSQLRAVSRGALATGWLSARTNTAKQKTIVQAEHWETLFGPGWVTGGRKPLSSNSDAVPQIADIAAGSRNGGDGGNCPCFAWRPAARPKIRGQGRPIGRRRRGA